MRKNIWFEIRSELESWNLDSTDDHIETTVAKLLSRFVQQIELDLV